MSALKIAGTICILLSHYLGCFSLCPCTVLPLGMLRLPCYCVCSDLNLDTKLELLRAREYMEYSFHTHPVYRDGKYRGQWKDAMPHGKWAYCSLDAFHAFCSCSLSLIHLSTHSLPPFSLFIHPPSHSLLTHSLPPSSLFIHPPCHSLLTHSLSPTISLVVVNFLKKAQACSTRVGSAKVVSMAVVTCYGSQRRTRGRSILESSRTDTWMVMEKWSEKNIVVPHTNILYM